MAAEMVVDYAGHPCRTTEAFQRFDYAVAQARAAAAHEPREIARQIGRALGDVQDRISVLVDALNACQELLSGAEEGPRAIVAMSEEYGITCSNRFGELAGLVLVALERGVKFSAVASGADHDALGDARGIASRQAGAAKSPRPVP